MTRSSTSCSTTTGSATTFTCSTTSCGSGRTTTITIGRTAPSEDKRRTNGWSKKPEPERHRSLKNLHLRLPQTFCELRLAGRAKAVRRSLGEGGPHRPSHEQTAHQRFPFEPRRASPRQSARRGQTFCENFSVQPYANRLA